MLHGCLEILPICLKEQNMLLDIRKGKYMKEDGTYKEEYFELQES